MTKDDPRVARLRRRVSISIPLLLVFCLPVGARAQDRTPSSAAAQEQAASGLIEAVVMEVEGTNLKLAGGITIDISKASLFSAGDIRVSVTIKPGMSIRARIVGSDPASSAFIADLVRVQLEDHIVLSGALQEVDLDRGSVTLLNRHIRLPDNGAFPTPLPKLKVGMPVSLIVKPVGNDLVATIIYPKLPLPLVFP